MQNSAAYSKYKSQLDNLFKPGGSALPDSLAQKLGPATEAGKAHRAVLDALKKSPGEATLEAYLAVDPELPPDARLLTKLLDTKKVELLGPVLTQLLAVIEDGKKPNRMLLIQRLETVSHSVQDDGIAELIAMTRAALDS